MGHISLYNWSMLFIFFLLPLGIFGGVFRYFLTKKYYKTQYEHNLVDLLTLAYSGFAIFITWLICMLVDM